jgi:hypothetical protein
MARLLTIAAAVPGVAYTARNDLGVDDVALPAIVVLDGDEQIPDMGARLAGKIKAARLVTMSAEVHILQDGEPATLGSELNALRVAVIRAILDDATLASIVGANGAIDPVGCSVGFAQGTRLQGELALVVRFTYPLIFADL